MEHQHVASARSHIVLPRKPAHRVRSPRSIIGCALPTNRSASGSRARLQAGGSRQRDGLREVGDLSLFISGFFADSLARSLVDVDYYIQLGECAYGSLATARRPGVRRCVRRACRQVLGMRGDVLSEVSERSALASNSDVLRLYEKWMRDAQQAQRRSASLNVELFRITP